MWTPKLPIEQPTAASVWFALISVTQIRTRCRAIGRQSVPRNTRPYHPWVQMAFVQPGMFVNVNILIMLCIAVIFSIVHNRKVCCSKVLPTVGCEWLSLGWRAFQRVHINSVFLSMRCVPFGDRRIHATCAFGMQVQEWSWSVADLFIISVYRITCISSTVPWFHIKIEDFKFPTYLLQSGECPSWSTWNNSHFWHYNPYQHTCLFWCPMCFRFSRAVA